MTATTTVPAVPPCPAARAVLTVFVPGPVPFRIFIVRFLKVFFIGILVYILKSRVYFGRGLPPWIPPYSVGLVSRDHFPRGRPSVPGFSGNPDFLSPMRGTRGEMTRRNRAVHAANSVPRWGFRSSAPGRESRLRRLFPIVHVSVPRTEQGTEKCVPSREPYPDEGGFGRSRGFVPQVRLDALGEHRSHSVEVRAVPFGLLREECSKFPLPHAPYPREADRQQRVLQRESLAYSPSYGYRLEYLLRVRVSSVPERPVLAVRYAGFLAQCDRMNEEFGRLEYSHGLDLVMVSTFDNVRQVAGMASQCAVPRNGKLGLPRKIYRFAKTFW